MTDLYAIVAATHTVATSTILFNLAHNAIYDNCHAAVDHAFKRSATNKPRFHLCGLTSCRHGTAQRLVAIPAACIMSGGHREYGVAVHNF